MANDEFDDDYFPDQFEKDYALTNLHRNPAPELNVPVETSPRVWIGDLPYRTSFRQILSAVRGIGGVIQVDKTNLQVPMASGEFYWASMASVVFASKEAARDFIIFTRSWGIAIEKINPFGEPNPQPEDPLRFRNKAARQLGSIYAYPVLTLDSSTFNKDVQAELTGCTRVFKLSRVRITSVGFVICMMGLPDVIHVTYDKHQWVIEVEFTTVYAAARARSRILADGFVYNTGPVYMVKEEHEFDVDCPVSLLKFQKDKCDGHPAELLDGPATAPWISDKEFEGFRKLPFVIDWPIKHHKAMTYAGMEPRSLDNQWTLLKSTDYLSRRSWSWDVPAEAQETVEAFRTTIGMGEWSATWQRWFAEEAHRSDDLTRLVAYAAIAKHRRDSGGCNAAGDCKFCCGTLGAPVPEVVQDFLSGRIEATGIVGDDKDEMAVSNMISFLLNTVANTLDRRTKPQLMMTRRSGGRPQTR